MLPRPEAPARRLPYTTADMGERLAKRKAEQDAEEFKANALNTLANYKPKEDKPWYKDLGNAVVDAAGYVYDRLPQSNPISTPINMGGNAGVSMGGQGTGKSLVAEPARLAVRRAVGDITAIPRVGADSPSYTADQIREQGVARGVLGAAIDYSQFIPVVAKGAGFTGDAVNAYKLAMMERQANPFPALRGATNVIDVVPGSRLPARIVDSPAPPATRLAQAQTNRALPPAVQRALPAANIPKPGMVLPDSLAGIRDLPTLPSQLNFADFQSMPEYQQYLQAGQGLPTAQELAEFGFDPERAYMVHSGPGDLVGGVLDPNFTGARNMGTKGLNTSMREQLVTNYKQADSIVKSLSTGLANFEQTGIWNGPQILNNVTKLINRDASRILPVNELGLNQIINVNDMPNKEFFVGKIRNMINSYQKTVTDFGPAAKLAEQGDYLSVFPASVGTYKGAVAPTNGATYLASSPAEQITNLMGFNSVAETGLPEYQMFGQQSPLATINYGNAGSSLNVEQLAAARAFFLRKVIEDRMARGLYEQPLAPPTPATPATRLGNALAQMTLDARAAQGGVRDAGVLRFPGGEPTPELPSAQLSQPTFRERKVPESTKITVEFNGQPSQQEPQAFVIRAFDPTFNKYKGALTMEWDPQKGKAIVDGLGTTDAMVVPQILASAAHVVRKFYGNIQFPLEPSTNLSVHSRPLVERLQQAGLVDPNFELPKPSELNTITKQSSEPSDFAAPDAFFDTQVINPLAYQPTYNDVLKKLVESKRQAKLQGEYGKLATSSKELQTLKSPNNYWGLNNTATYRANMDQFGFPQHPLISELSDSQFDNLLTDFALTPRTGAKKLIDIWDTPDPKLVEDAGYFASSYDSTDENLLKFPQLLYDANLINGETRQRLLVELQDLLK
jgi:hypothetical protein